MNIQFFISLCEANWCKTKKETTARRSQEKSQQLLASSFSCAEKCRNCGLTSTSSKVV